MYLNLNEMSNTLYIGGAGAGKTTLSSAISKQFENPLFLECSRHTGKIKSLLVHYTDIRYNDIVVLDDLDFLLMRADRDKIFTAIITLMKRYPQILFIFTAQKRRNGMANAPMFFLSHVDVVEV